MQFVSECMYIEKRSECENLCEVYVYNYDTQQL